MARRASTVRVWLTLPRWVWLWHVSLHVWSWLIPLTWLTRWGPPCLTPLWAPCGNRVHTERCFQRTMPRSGTRVLFSPLFLSPGKPPQSALLYILLSGAFVRLEFSTLAVYFLQLGPQNSDCWVKASLRFEGKGWVSKATADPTIGA